MRVAIVHNYKHNPPICGAHRYGFNLCAQLNRVDGVEADIITTEELRNSFDEGLGYDVVMPVWSAHGDTIDRIINGRALKGIILHGRAQTKHRYRYDFVVANSLQVLSYYTLPVSIPVYVLYPPYEPISPVKKRGQKYITLPSSHPRKGSKHFINFARTYPDLKCLMVMYPRTIEPPTCCTTIPVQANYGVILGMTDIMFHLSFYESFGYAWMEAGGAGIPVVGVETDGMRELMLDKWGIVIKKHTDYGAMREAVDVIRLDYSTWSRRAKQFISKHFNSQKKVEEFAHWLRRLI